LVSPFSFSTEEMFDRSIRDAWNQQKRDTKR